MFLPGTPASAIVILESGTGSINLTVGLRPSCGFLGETQFGYVMVFGNDGVRSVTHFDLPPGMMWTNATIPLNGPAPYVLAGEVPTCVDPNLSGYWLLPGQAIEPPPEVGQKWFYDVKVGVTVPRGEQWGRAVVDQPIGQFRIPGGPWPQREFFEGDRYGRIELTDSNGERARYDRYSILGNEHDIRPFTTVPGPYTIELTLERPATTDTVWPYMFQVARLGPEMCVYGDFDWAGC